MSTMVPVVLSLACRAVFAVDVQESWVDRIDGPASMNDYGQAVAVAGDGSVYITGFIFEQVQSNLFAPRFLTARYDSSGTRLWERTYAGTFATGAAAADHIAIDTDGNIVVSGSTNQGQDWAVVKYDPAGNELWRRVYATTSSFLTEPEDMAIDADGNICLVGDIGGFYTSGALVKFSSAGVELWSQQYLGPASEGALFHAVSVDAAGNVYAAGAVVVPNLASEFSVVQYDSSGTFQWLATDGYPGSVTHDRATDMTIDGEGNIVAVGFFGINSVVGIDLAVVKLDPAGGQVWRQLYVGPADRVDSAAEVAIDSANGIVVVGYSGVAFDDYDALTLKYSTTGTFLWEQRIGGEDIHWDRASGVAVDGKDNIYVCGTYDPIGGSQFFTTRYDADGTQQWMMSYAGPMGGGSGANDVAVGDDGSVFVTGDSPDPVTESDIATIRYEQTPASTPGDVDGDGDVDILDLLALLAAWGPCPSPPANCSADFDGNGAVDILDLLELLTNWP